MEIAEEGNSIRQAALSGWSTLNGDSLRYSGLDKEQMDAAYLELNL